MTREEAIEIFKLLRQQDTRVDADEYEQALEMAISALEQQPCDTSMEQALLLEVIDKFLPTECEDAISREDRIKDLIGAIENDDCNYWTPTKIASALKQLPSVTQKSGKWIFVDKAKEHAHCSECDYGNVDLFDGRPHNYCQNCGAKMESEDKE